MGYYNNTMNTITQNLTHRHLSNLLSNVSTHWPDKEALVFDDVRITWGEVQQRVQGLAGAFLEMGVQRGDRIGILCTTRPEYILTYLAASQVGAILVGFNINFTPREIKKQAEIAKPVVMVVLRSMKIAGQLESCFETMPTVRHCIAVGEPVPTGWWRFEQLVENRNPGLAQALDERAATLKEDDGALMVFTGGVTGTTKGAMLSHKNIIANIDAQNRHLGWRNDDRAILHLPMNHVSGATLLTIGALMSGATLVMLEQFHPEQTLELVQRERVTILGQVPAMWIMEFVLPHFDSFDLSAVRMTIIAGAPSSIRAKRRMATIAPIAYHAYGLTEVAGMVTYNRPKADLATVLNTVGRIAPEFELQIVDREGKPVGPNIEGEIQVRGDCVMTGYFDNPEETARVLSDDGWLSTGDLGRLDEREYLTITGMSKRMYFLGGYNVFPAEVETYLDQHPDIEQSVCFAVEHPVLGAVGEVYVVPRTDASLSVKEVRSYCKEGLARYKRPANIYIVDTLPLATTG